ncbi:MAG: iron-containing alcohol dehydrogenase [Deltaproteobacteria bacterium]|nr:iron-containing alcohol dehydrogenase [Deltaproteobacteria bacterium]
MWFGAGRIVELPRACRVLGMQRPLLVTDSALARLPLISDALRLCEEAGLDCGLYSQVQGNPVESNVTGGVQQYRQSGRDGVIALGGGSGLDAAKAIALMVGQERPLWDFEDREDWWTRAHTAGIAPLVAVPTTAGTGSEVGRAAVIVDPSDLGKKIIFHPRMQPDLVLADPELTCGLPPGLTAATGMDALAHCFEAYCAPGYHPMADGIALEGLRMIHANLMRAFEHGHDTTARTHMLMAAAMGATAFQKGLGLIHALSHPVGGLTGLHHGTANAIFQPYVMVHNRSVIEARMPRLARFVGLSGERFEDVLDWVLDLRRDLGLPHRLEGVDDDDRIATIVSMAAADPSLATNPKPCSTEELERVLRKSIAGDLTP